MTKLSVSFHGRKAGSIGIEYNISTVVELDNPTEDNIRLQLYKGDVNGQAYEHIYKLTVNYIVN